MPIPIRNRSDEDDEDRRSSSLAGLVVLLVVLVISLMIVRKLQVRQMLEECALAPHPACEVTADQLRVSRLFDRAMADNR
jgi:hypothetical protein